VRCLRAALAHGMLGAALLHGTAWAQHPASDAMAKSSVNTAAPDAVLVDQDGRRFALKELRGKPAVVAFIYTSCHHVCPLIFDSVGAVQQRARSAGLRDVRSVFVTVDPEIDTPEVLKAYAGRRSADLASTVFLTGSAEELRAVWDGYGVKIKRLGRGLVDHPPLTFLLDAQGIVRYRYYGGVLDTEAVVADLRDILQAGKR
jgi:protein SCO1/2